jgi:chromosome segregation ATPase
MPGPEPVTGHERELWSAKAGAEALRRFEEGEQRATEAGWRQAFKVAREEVAELERRCARYRAELHQPLNTFTLDQARQKLPEDEQRLRAARERLDELERRASRLGIPREWR